jgi:urate oxidase
MSDDRFTYTISYGKTHVTLYRAYARPLAGLRAIPESAFTGRSNSLFALEVDVEVFGTNFLPAYTQGDNSAVVATDSMKNWMLRQALAYDGATLEGFLDLLGHRFLDAYPQMQSLRITGRQLPFAPAPVPQAAGGFGESDALYSLSQADAATAALDFARAEDGSPRLTGHSCGWTNMRLLKVTGSAFTRFVRDDYTTLPERGDRPLYIALDVSWRYTHPADALSADRRSADPARYVPGEQVRDLARVVFHEFVSESIQHLVHEMGQRLLARFPQLAEVAFASQNLTPDPVGTSDADPRVKVYASPFPAYGLIRLSMSRKEE